MCFFPLGRDGLMKYSVHFLLIKIYQSSTTELPGFHLYFPNFILCLLPHVSWYCTNFKTFVGKKNKMKLQEKNKMGTLSFDVNRNSLCYQPSLAHCDSYHSSFEVLPLGNGKNLPQATQANFHKFWCTTPDQIYLLPTMLMFCTCFPYMYVNKDWLLYI